MDLKKVIQKAIDEIDVEKVIDKYLLLSHRLMSEEYGTGFTEYDVLVLAKYLFNQEENKIIDGNIFYGRPTPRSC